MLTFGFLLKPPQPDKGVFVVCGNLLSIMIYIGGKWGPTYQCKKVTHTTDYSHEANTAT